MLDSLTLAGTSPAAAGTAVLATVSGLSRYRNIKATASLVGATGGALDVYLQYTPDNGTTWVDWAHFPQMAAAASAVKYSCDSRFGALTAPTVVGVGTAGAPGVALAANVCVGGGFGTGMRVVCVAGASTSAGAAISVVISGDSK